MLRTLFILLGALGVGDTLVVSAYSNMNFGTVLPLILGAPLLLIGIFFRPVTAFFSSTVLGAWIKWALVAAYTAFFTLVAICSCLIYREGHASPPAGADAVIVLGCGGACKGFRVCGGGYILRTRLLCGKIIKDGTSALFRFCFKAQSFPDHPARTPGQKTLPLPPLHSVPCALQVFYPPCGTEQGFSRRAIPPCARHPALWSGAFRMGESACDPHVGRTPLKAASRSLRRAHQPRGYTVHRPGK